MHAHRTKFYLPVEKEIENWAARWAAFHGDMRGGQSSTIGRHGRQRIEPCLAWGLLWIFLDMQICNQTVNSAEKSSRTAMRQRSSCFWLGMRLIRVGWKGFNDFFWLMLDCNFPRICVINHSNKFGYVDKIVIWLKTKCPLEQIKKPQTRPILSKMFQLDMHTNHHTQ